AYGSAQPHHGPREAGAGEGILQGRIGDSQPLHVPESWFGVNCQDGAADAEAAQGAKTGAEQGPGQGSPWAASLDDEAPNDERAADEGTPDYGANNTLECTFEEAGEAGIGLSERHTGECQQSAGRSGDGYGDSHSYEPNGENPQPPGIDESDTSQREGVGQTAAKRKSPYFRVEEREELRIN